MNRSLSLTILILAFSFSSSSNANEVSRFNAQGEACTREAIHSLSEEFEKAVENADSFKSSSFYATQGILLPPDSGPVVGREAIQVLQNQMIELGVTRLEHEIQDIHFISNSRNSSFKMPSFPRSFQGHSLIAVEQGMHAAYQGDSQTPFSSGHYTWVLGCNSDKKWEVLVDSWTVEPM